MTLFREKYKNANCFFDTDGAKKRVEKRLEEKSPGRIKYRQISAIAACFVIVIAGFSAYKLNKSASDTPQMTRMTDVENAAIMPHFDMREQTPEEFEKKLSDSTYKKRSQAGATILEKNKNGIYECWIEKDGEITKITAEGITDKEKEEILLTVLQ